MQNVEPSGGILDEGGNRGVCGVPDQITDLNSKTRRPGVARRRHVAHLARKKYGCAVFRAREVGDMPPPGDARPARLAVEIRDLIWDAAYAPIAVFIEYATGRLNVLQFLTIRRYLTLVFSALVLLLLVLAIWS